MFKTSFFLKFVLYFFVLVLVLFSAGCEKQQTKKELHNDVSSIEKKWMEKFFRDMMLEESAIYTLWGSKPITVIVLHYFSEEEINAWVSQMTEEEKKELIISPETYDLPENWKKWEKIQSRFPMPKYLLFKRVRPDDKRFEDVYFINILQTALILNEHYDLFKKYIGRDFDPLQEVFNIENKDSFYWKNDMLLHGILFGFGMKNSFCFEWKYRENAEYNPKVEDFLDSLEFSFEDDARNFLVPTINHFRLPPFASFSPKGKDEVIEKYKKERDEIKAAYKGKDFLELTLEKLTSR